ncbi:hypothetical protein NPIL_560261 [Nephila pilipes]|uniref:Uncharacterized protein n=1 Tax=Nephila pilipes TaxID=299642 RepID=A0A8X6IJL0_NEPPI|nr:hypothetical protein NPIL_560261 [Nephila pilipes]
MIFNSKKYDYAKPPAHGKQSKGVVGECKSHLISLRQKHLQKTLYEVQGQIIPCSALFFQQQRRSSHSEAGCTRDPTSNPIGWRKTPENFPRIDSYAPGGHFMQE